MPAFITRVELHGASAADYQTLDSSMEAAGFSRSVSNVDGTRVFLPTGQYAGTAEVEAANVSQLAQAAALKVKKGFAIFVAEVNSAAWYGLDPAPASENPG